MPSMTRELAHSVENLEAGSRYIGHKCPVTRTELQEGDQIVVCHQHGEVLSWNAVPMLEGLCPYCRQRINLRKTFGSVQEVARPRKNRETKPRIGLVTLAILGLIGICGIGGMIGYRLLLVQPNGTTAPVPAVSQSTESPAIVPPTTDSSSVVEVSSPTTTLRPTSNPPSTPTEEPSPTPAPSPTSCSIVVAPHFATAWSLYEDELKCPVNQSHSHEAASQDFERGYLLWRIEPDQVYVMYDDGRLGIYPMSVYPESVRQNPPGGDPSIQPPAGFQQPVRGFGLIWRDNSEVREGIGWALEGEARADWFYGFEAQDFVGGTVIHECRMGVRVLLSSGTWIKIEEGNPCN